MQYYPIQQFHVCVIGETLSWSRSPWQSVPPFATPHGPSCLYFYHFDGTTTTDMTLGFKYGDYDDDDSISDEEDYLEDLTEHVRKVRPLPPP